MRLLLCLLPLLMATSSHSQDASTTPTPAAGVEAEAETPEVAPQVETPTAETTPPAPDVVPPPDPVPGAKTSHHQGVTDGQRIAAANYDTGLWPYAGFCSGLVGMPWCVVVPGLACLMPVEAPLVGQGTVEYQQGFVEGYREEAEDSRFWSTTTGMAVGTGIAVGAVAGLTIVGGGIVLLGAAVSGGDF